MEMAEENSPQQISKFYSDLHKLYAISLFCRLEYVCFRDLISGDGSAEEKSNAGSLYQNGGIMRLFSIFSTFLVNKLGKERIETAFDAIGVAIGVTFTLGLLSAMVYGVIRFFGLFSLDAEFERKLILFAVNPLLISLGVGIFLGFVLDSYKYSHCGACKRDLACERVGEPLVEEIEDDGVIKEVTTERYQCRFCGNVTYRISKSDKYPDMV